MTLVRDVMTTDVVAVRPDARLQELVNLMLERGVSGLPVVDGEHRVVGVCDRADLVTRRGFDPAPPRLLSIVDDALHARHNLWRLKAGALVANELMTTPPQTVRVTDDVRLAASKMVTLAHKRLPVIDDGGRLVGIIAQRDILRLLHHADDRSTALSPASPSPSRHSNV